MKIEPEKLKMARMLAGFSVTELADKLNISKQSLSQYENGVVPKLDVFLNLLRILDIKKDFLEIPLQNNRKIRNTFFRSSASTISNERKNQEVKTFLTIALYDFLSEYLDMPKPNLPIINNFDDIEEVACQVRNYWNIGMSPIKNLVSILEVNGILVSTFNSSEKNESKRIDGYTQQVVSNNANQQLYCIVVEDQKDSAVRKNFSLAHELGHIILHSSEDFNEMSRIDQSKMEDEANQFAAAFLLPKNEFIKDINKNMTLNDFVFLKKKWFVSIGAMMLRARALGVISQEEYLKLIKNYSYRRYRNKEPFDDVFQIYKPVLFKKSLEILFENGYNLEQLIDEMSKRGLALPLAQIEELMGLGANFFDRYKSKLETPIINIKNYLNENLNS